MKNQNIILDKEEGIATITLNRPQKLNAFTSEMEQEIIEATEDVAKDPQIKVVILTGAGRGFCAGRDFSEPLPVRGASDTALAAIEGITRLGVIITNIRNMPKPCIAMVNGPAMGPGFGFALACDITIASEEAIFGLVFARMGVHPECGITYFLPRLVGLAKASELLFTAKTLDAKEAERLGLVNRVVPQDQLIGTTRELAVNLAHGPSIALSLTKISLNQAWNEGLAQALEREATAQAICAITEDTKEAQNAFREKRPPAFRGK